MKISSTIQPTKSYEILRSGNKCTVIFYANVISSPVIDGMTGNSVPSWDYEKYILETDYSTSLAAQVESDYAAWLQKAKDAEQTANAEKVRNYRDNLLNQCDIKYCNSEKWADMTEDQQKAWVTYKQALRDVPTQDGFPYAVNWPVIPI